MSVAGPELNVVHKDNLSETYRCSASYGETVKPEQSEGVQLPAPLAGPRMGFPDPE